MTKQPLNILSVEASELSFGGDETRLLNQCRLLNKNNFNCIVCTPLSSRANMTSHFDNANANIIYIRILPFNLKKLWAPVRFFLLFVNFLMYMAQLIRVIHREKIDVIDSRLLGGGIYGVLAKQLTGLPVMVTLYHKSELNSLLEFICVRLLRLSDAIICDSEMRLEELKNWIGSEKPRYIVIPSAIELKFSNDEEISKIEHDKKVSGKVIITQIAGIIPFKGQDLLIDAFHTISAKHKHAELWIVGYPRNINYYNSLKLQAKYLGLQDRVHFISYPGYIGNIFKMTDIQVHATRFDSLPNAILEGMSIGKPLIASAVGGIPEVVEHNVTGLLFNAGDRELLSIHLDELLTGESRRKRLGQAAKIRFEERYSPARLTGQLEDLITEISLGRK